MALPRWRGARADLLREVAASHGCGRAGSAELSKRLGEHVSANAMAGGLARIKQRGHEAGGKIPFPVQPISEPLKAPAARVPNVRRAEGYLVVPDLQMPFHEPRALDFCERVRREFAISKDNVLLVGDEIDNFHGKGADKAQDPDASHTPGQELLAAKEELKRWYATYERARIARSNHGTRYERRAAEAHISSQWMKLYRDVIEAPEGWRWADRWIIQASKQHFLLEHGHEGKSNTESKVVENGYSTVHGHFTQAKTVWVSNHLGRRLWGMSVGALIDYESYAFKYAKKYPRRPDYGCGVILDGGRVPVWVPFWGNA